MVCQSIMISNRNIQSKWKVVKQLVLQNHTNQDYFVYHHGLILVFLQYKLKWYGTTSIIYYKV